MSLPKLSRRERQIMDVLFSRGRASAAEILEAIDDPPGNSAMRTLLRVLEEKGHVKHEEVGRVYYYIPTVPLEAARRSALSHLVDTFFEGSMENVVSTLVKLNRKKLDPDQAARIARMIEESAKKGR
ncbi:MAG TPA: BlaI/MecI/CopY family transcriptional regulator [Thermoanaerobaculia bacterium]|nr:BlaI/MecI/CopY family transcriptional regulator [Thermoanaerobaculia bacterium]